MPNIELYINDRIRTRKVTFFNNFDFTLRFDSVASTFSFSFYFDPNNNEHREMCCIGHFHKIQIKYGSEVLLTGYAMSNTFEDSSVPTMATISGYSLPGVLEDCNIPIDLYPLESDGLTISEIVQKILGYFEIGYSIDSSVSSKMNEVLAVSVAGETQTIAGYLSELCAQKYIVITHDEQGRLLFTRAKTKQSPILTFGEPDGVPFTNMKLEYNGQGMHSIISVVKDADEDGGNAGEASISNPYVPFVYRPKIVKQSSGTDIDSSLVAKQALSAELKGMKLEISTDRWEIGNSVVKPNNTITVTNRNVYLYNKSTWFIESVRLFGNNEKTTATLTCVIPEVYNGGIPKYMYEGVNLH